MINPLCLEGKRILVTGASSGIGQSCARILSRLGARLLITARNEMRLIETLNSLDGTGHLYECLDLCDPDTISPWLKKMATEGGLFDGVVHCAGVELTKPLKMMKISDYSYVMNVNVATAFSLAQGFRQKGVFHAPASIVLLSSVAGNVGQPAHSAYCASKAAVQGLSRSLALELSRDGIRVNCISPGLVKTQMTAAMEKKISPSQFQDIINAHPLGLGSPDDIAYAAAFLLAETGRWITGSNLIVDGGFTAH